MNARMTETDGGIEYVHGVPFRRPRVEYEACENNPEGKDLREETAKWIIDNREVADLFLRFARELALKERPFGISLITERVRWEIFFQHNGKYKINNNHRAYLARWIVAMEPRLEQYLHFRKVHY